MKILLCTNTFSHITHGPAKFANLILEINQIYKYHQIKILTEDVEFPSEIVYKMKYNIPVYLKPLSQIIRMFLYHKSVEHIYKTYSFNIVIYNNSFLGLVNAVLKKGYVTVGMINDDNNLSTSFKNFKWKYLWFKRFFFKQLEYLSVNKHDYIIANSNYLLKQILENYFISENKVKRLYKAIDISLTLKINERSFKEPYKILFVKADYSRGGLEILANALAILKTKKFEINIIGPEKRFETNILKMFRGQNIKVRFLGEQSQQVVYKYMQCCDIFCVPSFKEALGVANMEALANGISVITSNVGGIPEVMDNGKNGWLVKPGLPLELAYAIQECIENPYVRDEKISNGWQYLDHFSKERMLESFISIIDNIKIK